MKFLVKGIMAPIFWLSVLALWLLILAGLVVATEGTSASPEISLPDAYWFSYISITTVGLGDIYFTPETVTVASVFSTAFLSLLGFVLMGNFLLKLAEWLIDVIPAHGQPLEEILEESRNVRARQVSSQRQTSLSQQSKM